jgi:hypothetical protein
MLFAAAWRTFGSLTAKHPSVKTALSALVWLPTAIVFTNYGYTVKSVRGRSMQVRRTTPVHSRLRSTSFQNGLLTPACVPASPR